jgi:carbamoyl-phosphate synthase large subunit
MAYYRSLNAWQAAHEFAKAVAAATRRFPRDERYELTSQLRRAAVSAPANLAEGQGRFGAREALRHTRIAAASLVEADYLLLYALECGYVSRDESDRLMRLREQARRLVHGLATSLDRAVKRS